MVSKMKWPKPPFHIILPSLALIILFFISKANAQDIHTVNIFFFYEDDNVMETFEKVKEHVEKTPKYEVKVGRVHSLKLERNQNGNVDIEEAAEAEGIVCDFVDKAMQGDEPPELVIDFTRHGTPSEAVKSIVKNLNLPTISGTFGQVGDVREWRDLTSNQKNYMIQVSPPADVIIQSVRSIVDITNMTSAVVLFNPDYEMYHKYKSLLQNMPTRHLLTKLKTKNKDIRAQIDRFVHVDIANFFIAASPDEVSDVLAQASDPAAPDGPYFSDEYAWYSMSLEEDQIPHCKGCKMDISLVHLSPELTNSNELRRNIFKATGLPARLTEMFYFDLALDALLAYAELKKENKWPELSPIACTGADFGENYVRNVTEELDLDLLTALTNVGEENIFGPFNMEENGKNYPEFRMKIQRFLFKKGNDKPYSTELIGYWRAGFGEHELITYELARNLLPHMAKTVFRIVTVVQPPFVYWIDGCQLNTTDKYHHCFKGYCIDLLREIQQELRFNYTIRNLTDYGMMHPEPPHEWNGMVAELKNRRADIALGAMSVMAERESVVDFTVPYYDLVGISILMKKPKAATSLFKFLTVLEYDVWMTILISYFITSFLMWVFDRLSPYSYRNNRAKYIDDEEQRHFNLKECLWFCMTSLTPQGGGEAPKNLSGRFVAATWWLFGFIIIASYTANLAAFLTVSRLDTPVESLEDLSRQFKVQYAPVMDSSAWIYFDRMKNIEEKFFVIWKDLILNDSLTEYDKSLMSVWDYPVSNKYTKIWHAMLENSPPATFELGVERVKGDETKKPPPDNFALLGEATDIKYQALINCLYQQVGEEFSRKPYAIAVQKGSPLKESFSHMILKLLNQRQLEQLKETWWHENDLRQECPREDNQSDGISIHNIGGVFIVIFVGIVMACFTLIFEYFWLKKKGDVDEAEDMAEMALPQPSKEFVTQFGTGEKTNFNTQYNKPAPIKNNDLPSIENAW